MPLNMKIEEENMQGNKYSYQKLDKANKHTECAGM